MNRQRRKEPVWPLWVGNSEGQVGGVKSILKTTLGKKDTPKMAALQVQNGCQIEPPKMAALHRQTVEEELEVLIWTSNLGGRGAISSPNNIQVQPLFGFNMPMVNNCSVNHTFQFSFSFNFKDNSELRFSPTQTFFIPTFVRCWLLCLSLQSDNQVVNLQTERNRKLTTLPFKHKYISKQFPNKVNHNIPFK